VERKGMTQWQFICVNLQACIKEPFIACPFLLKRVDMKLHIALRSGRRSPIFEI